MPIVSLLLHFLSARLLGLELVLKPPNQQVSLHLEILPHSDHSQKIRCMQVLVSASLMHASRAQLSIVVSLVSRESYIPDFGAESRLLRQTSCFNAGLGHLGAHEGVLGVSIAAGRQDALLALSLWLSLSVPGALGPGQTPAARTFLENKTDGFDGPELSLLQVSLTSFLKDRLIHSMRQHFVSKQRDFNSATLSQMSGLPILLDFIQSDVKRVSRLFEPGPHWSSLFHQAVERLQEVLVSRSSLISECLAL